MVGMRDQHLGLVTPQAVVLRLVRQLRCTLAGIHLQNLLHIQILHYRPRRLEQVTHLLDDILLHLAVPKLVMLELVTNQLPMAPYMHIELQLFIRFLGI